jgi:hypothetical protein
MNLKRLYSMKISDTVHLLIQDFYLAINAGVVLLICIMSHTNYHNHEQKLTTKHKLFLSTTNSHGAYMSYVFQIVHYTR